MTGPLRRLRISTLSLLAGLAGGAAAFGFGLHWLHAALAGWCALVLAHLALLLRRLWSAGPEAMRRHAEVTDERRTMVLTLSLLAAATSVAGVGLDVAMRPGGIPAFGVVTVALSWFYIHTLFAQDYAREFYLSGGGIRFHGGAENPAFSEFLYLSIGVGTTNGVTDVDTHSAPIRRIATLHSIIAFFFNTVIIAGTVGIVGGLLGG